VIANENARLLNELRQRTNDSQNRSTTSALHRIAWCRPRSWLPLGQLTAGIAHEIKNPLNRHNFSAMSAELTDELKDLLKSAALGKDAGRSR